MSPSKARFGRPFALALVLCLATAGCKRGGDEGETPAEGSGEPAQPLNVIPEGSAEAEAPSETEGSAAPAAPTPNVDLTPPRDRRDDEYQENRELAARLGLAPPDPLLVSDLLTRADVREITRFQGELAETSLEGIPSGAYYNTIRLQADGDYGFALQVWQFDEVRQLTAQFRRLRETYFDHELDSAGVGNEAFMADFQGILHYAFLHRASKSIAVVTCQRGLCDPTQTRELAQRVANRL